MNSKKKILVAPLDWGLGHATRCIPIARALEKEGYEVIFAADKRPLRLLMDEFPNNRFIKLSGYNVSYPKNGQMALSMLFQSFKIFKNISRERKALKQIIKEYENSTIYLAKSPEICIIKEVHIYNFDEDIQVILEEV